MSRLPPFLIKRTPKLQNIRHVRSLLDEDSIKTVCEEARCPNIGECFSSGTCTFMLLGNTCTRNCAFCGVSHGKPLPPDPIEPERIARAVEKLGLKYVVITSVTRDDLPDGGAGHFAAVIAALRGIKVEVLIPDFLEQLEAVLDAGPFVLNHNIETVPRLYPAIRPQADFERSLDILKRAKASHRVVYTKSGFMVGLGEKREEISGVLKGLQAAGCDIVTIGQYLPPTRRHIGPARYVLPEEFKEFEEEGKEMGLRVEAGPFVRSSYHAAEVINV